MFSRYNKINFPGDLFFKNNRSILSNESYGRGTQQRFSVKQLFEGTNTLV